MTNLDLFGSETEVKKCSNISQYQKFKAINYYRKSAGVQKCGTCRFHISGSYHDKIYHKCEKLGLSKSEATDIRVGHVCKLYKKGGG